MQIWKFLLKIKNYFLEKDFISQIDIGIFTIVVFIIIFFLFRTYIWREIGFFISDKKYNYGRCSEAKIFGCGHGDIHRHGAEMTCYGPLILSRKFVRRKICNKF